MKNKKIVAVFLVLSLAAVLFVGCGGAKADKKNPGNNNNDVVPPNAAAGKLGLGIVNSIAKSKDYIPAEGDQPEVLAAGQVDTIMAAVLFDADGKILKVDIDNAQTVVKFDADMKVTNRDDVLKTKVEKGEEYGMKKASSIGKEWYEQIDELEKWMVGKTVAEVKALKTKARDDSHPAVPDVPELTSLVTISVEDYIAAVEKAWNNAVDVENADKLGLGQEISIAKSKDYAPAEGDKPEVLPTAQVDTTIAATAFTADGKVAGVIIDTAQIVVNFNKDGKVTSDRNAPLKTKVEKGNDYGMHKVSSIGKEWYEQIAELEKWMVGKTVAEITGMKVKERDESHPAVPDVPELTSSVTINVGDYLAVVVEALQKAK
ncbi:MAG: hypothetical protein GX167_02330 [Firmicutes bacterium]|jgi:hypothetical protein|nr:hypothetical protein [Bacillota bacterium]